MSNTTTTQPQLVIQVQDGAAWSTVRLASSRSNGKRDGRKAAGQFSSGGGPWARSHAASRASPASLPTSPRGSQSAGMMHWSVRPPRCAKPAKEKVTSVGVLQFIPSSWHMAAIMRRGLFHARPAALS